MKGKATVFEDFADSYIHAFMEAICFGVSGGLYGDVIEVTEGSEGTFDKGVITKFIRFQHGDNDYSSVYGTHGNEELAGNPGELAKAFLELVDSDWRDKDHLLGHFPALVENAKKSFARIIGS